MNSNIRQMVGLYKVFLVCNRCGDVIDCGNAVKSGENMLWPSSVLCDSCLTAYVRTSVHDTIRFLVQVKDLGRGTFQDSRMYMVTIKYAEKGDEHFSKLDYIVGEMSEEFPIDEMWQPVIDRLKNSTYLKMIEENRAGSGLKPAIKLTRWDRLEL